MSADNVFRVTLDQSKWGQTIQNVIHFSGPSSDPLQRSALADEVETSWVNQVKLMQTDALHYFGIRVRLLESQFDTFTKPISINGTNSSESFQETFIAHTLRLRTGLLGRKNSGRVYIGGIKHDTHFQGVIGAPVTTNWQNKIDAIMAVFGPSGSSTFRLGVTSKTAPGPDFHTVARIELSTVVGIQRRRNWGVGI